MCNNLCAKNVIKEMQADVGSQPTSAFFAIIECISWVVDANQYSIRQPIQSASKGCRISLNGRDRHFSYKQHSLAYVSMARSHFAQSQLAALG